MYRNFTASEYKEQLSLADDYKVDGFLVYGVSHKGPYEILKDRLAAGNATVEYGLLHGFLEPILEFRVSNQRFWFVTAYGGAILSEWLHLACLFGSKINLLLGSCGGLHIEAKSRDLIVPTYSYANESTTRAYEPEANHRHYANQELRTNIINCLRTGMHKVWEGPTVTHQAMMAETWEDVQSWSQDGFYGVEMEASTMFAVSNYFRIPSAAILMIADNLIKQHTVLDINYKETSCRYERPNI